MRHQVTEVDTAIAVGSGDVPVLATPRLIAWLEAATVEAAAPYLRPGQTTVGISIRVDHTRASAIGTQVEVSADATPDDSGRRITFLTKAIDDTGASVGGGTIVRAVVDREHFLAANAR